MGIATSPLYLLDYVSATQDHYSIYHEEGTGMGYISGAEYVIEGTDIEALTYERPKAEEGLSLLSATKDYLHWELACQNTRDTEALLEVPLLLYKGYRAWDRDTGERFALSAGPNFNVVVHVPAGYEGTVEVDFVSPIYWRIAEMISLATALFWLLRSWVERVRKKMAHKAVLEEKQK